MANDLPDGVLNGPRSRKYLQSWALFCIGTDVFEVMDREISTAPYRVLKVKEILEAPGSRVQPSSLQVLTSTKDPTGPNPNHIEIMSVWPMLMRTLRPAH